MNMNINFYYITKEGGAFFLNCGFKILFILFIFSFSLNLHFIEKNSNKIHE